MAESQTPYNYGLGEVELTESLSPSRLSTYMKAAGFNSEYAFKLYLYNARLSKAFLFPIHILEVTLRNRMHKIFSGMFSPNWPYDTGFKALLTPESLSSLDKAISRSKSGPVESIVAELTFDFWSNLFRREYGAAVWETKLGTLFPGARYKRTDVQRIVSKINHLRNRIAHHEPIISLNASALHTLILEILEAMCTSTAEWVKHHSTLNQTIRTKPKSAKSSGLMIADRADSKFSSVAASDTLDRVGSLNFDGFILIKNNTVLVAVVTLKEIGAYFASSIEDNELVLELHNESYNNLVSKINILGNCIEVDANESLSTVAELFKTKKVKYILATDSKLGEIGVIAKSHRRY